MIFGVLLLSGIACGVLSSVPALEEKDYLLELPAIEGRIFVGVFFQAMMASIYVGIVAWSYPLVRRTGEHAAAAYLVFRSIGAAFLFAGIVTLSQFVVLGRSLTHAGSADPAEFEMIGTMLRHVRDGLNHVGMILPWCIGGIIMYRSFLESEVVPRWISVWGLIGGAATLAATILFMLGQVQLVTATYLMLNVPAAFTEVVLAVYLIFRGYSSAAQPAGFSS